MVADIEQQADKAPQPTVTLGEQLAKSRQAKLWSVGDVARRLHMDAWMIDALEANEFDRLGAPVFAKGHARQYVQLLGLDETVLQAATEWQAPAAPPLRMAKTTLTHSARGPSWVGKVLRWLFILIAVALVGGGLAWAIQMGPGAMKAWWPWPMTTASVNEAGERTLSLPEEAVAVREVQQSIVVQAAQDVVPLPQPELAEATDEPAIIAVVPELTLTLENDTWLEVYDANAGRLFYELATAGSTHRFEGDGPFEVVLGQGKGVNITWQGESVALPAGKRNKTLRLQIPQ